MDLASYAAQYSGNSAELLRDLARVRGSRAINADYQRAAASALQGFGIARFDAYTIAARLSAEQVRRLREHVIAHEEEAEAAAEREAQALRKEKK